MILGETGSHPGGQSRNSWGEVVRWNLPHLWDEGLKGLVSSRGREQSESSGRGKA